jgi:hypothetical protein
MSKSRWLVLSLAFLGWFNAGTVWLTQFSCYPLWPFVGRNEFKAYYLFWQQSTFGLVLIPFALAAVGSLALLVFSPPQLPRWSLWLGIAMQAGIEGMNWAWFWSLDRRIARPAGGLDPAAFQQLIVTNWLRIGLVTGWALLILWMLGRCLWPARSCREQRLLLGTSALAFYAVGCIWMVQQVCYRLWPHIGRPEAFTYHIAWWHSIWGVVFIPAGLAFLGSVAMLWIRLPDMTRRVAWIGFTLQVLTYALTAAWWGPLMSRLATPEAGLSLPLFHLLMTTHWGRVALLTTYGVLCCYMLVTSATKA